ncbi:MAG: lipoyl(octanoyl) transferase LipB [Solirubrobacteraceae bacterium]
MTGELWVCDLGAVDYSWAVALQERIQSARHGEQIEDVLLLLEHRPVYTRGRRSAPGELPLGAAWYAARGIEIVDTNRGGKITYHGPGQLVGYPIVRVSDAVAYVRMLEQVLVGALAEQGLAARARAQDGPAYTGVWVQERKIASIGVHVARGVTTHGFAVNVVNDLRPFGWVVACGLPDVEMTSIIEEQRRVQEAEGLHGGAGEAPADLMRRFRRAVDRQLAQALARRPRPVSLAQLEDYLAVAERATAASSTVSSRSGSLVS